MAATARTLALIAACVSAGCASAPEPTAGGPLRLRLERVDGGSFDLGTTRGSVVLVNFFATWCPPCVEELPLLARLQGRYRAEGLQVIAISMDLDGRAVLEPFLDYFGDFGFPVLLADARYFDGETPFGPIRVLPTTAVIDRRGRFLGAQAGLLDAVETERLVQTLLRQ